MAKSLAELGLKEEQLPTADLSEIPELGSYTPPPQPGRYRFRLPANMTQVFDTIDATVNGVQVQRIKVIFDQEKPLMIVQTPAHRTEYLNTPFTTQISGRERPRGKEKIEVSDLAYLLKALGIVKAPTNQSIVQQLMTKGGAEFNADITYSFGCREDKEIYVRDPNDPNKTVKCDGTVYQTKMGCGKRYYQDRDVKKDEHGNYPLEFQCTNPECGAILRGFANLDRISDK